MRRWTTKKVEPIAFDVAGFVDYSDGRRGEFRQDLPRWPRAREEGREVRELRRYASVTLRTGADAFGLKPSQLSGLEMGHEELADPNDWPDFLEAARGLWGKDAAKGRAVCVCGHTRRAHWPSDTGCGGNGFLSPLPECRCRGFSLDRSAPAPGEGER